MENDIIEVTKTSISVRGNWVRQTTNEKPDFTNLKFSVKLSDKSTLKYPSWEDFYLVGGRYTTEFGDCWSYIEGVQPIVFYLDDCPDVKLTKSVKVQKTLSDIETVTPKIKFYSGDEILPNDFTYKVRFTDNSFDYPNPSEVTIEPNLIPKGIEGKFKCIFKYSYDGISVSKEYEIDVLKKLYSIKNIESDFGSTKFIIGGKESSEAWYSTPTEDPIFLTIRAVPKDKNHRFKCWLLSTGGLNIENPSYSETTLEIPVGFGQDFFVKSTWDKKVVDAYGNIFNIENSTLESVEIHSDKVEVPTSVNNIAAKVFNAFDIREVSLPDTLQTIGEGAFSDCVNLTHIDIPSSVNLMENSAFAGCTSLESVKFNQIKPFILGSKCFQNCSVLRELDFLALKDNFKDCIFGDGEHTDVWEGCRIRVVKLTKGNFFKDTIKISTKSAFTVRTPGSFKVTVHSKTDTVRARVIGTTADGGADKISKDLIRKNAYCRKFDRNNNEDTFLLNSYNYSQNYDLRESCGCYVVGEGNTDFDIEIKGMGNSQFNYPVYVEVYSKYRFTPNGSADRSFIYEGDIGEGFSNWNMMDYVNDILYPNIMKESGIRLIDLMLPIYNRRQF